MNAVHDSRVLAIRRVLASASTVEQEAAALGVSPEVFEGWLDFALDSAGKQRRVTRRRVGVVASVLAAGVALVALPRAFAAGTCTQFLPAPLVTFCVNEPAVASEVNGNFKTLADAVIARTGSLSAVAPVQYPNLTFATATNSAVGSVTTNNTVVVEGRDNVGNPRIELRGATPYIDFANDATSDFHGRISVNPVNKTLDLTSPSGVTSSCAPGYWTVSMGHLCVGPLESAGTGHGAIEFCKLKWPSARVCTHNDLQQACGNIYGFLPGATIGWYGDIGGDDLLYTWNFNTCAGGNNSGGLANANGGPMYPFHCCY